MNETIKLTPKEGKKLMDKRTKATYTEVVCAESDRHFFVEVDAE